MAAQDRGLISHFGPVEVDWPRSLGYFGGVGLAVAAGVIEPPVGLFIAAIPFLKMINHPKAPLPVRFVGQVLDGASKPVGGDTEATIQLKAGQQGSAPRPGIWTEARELADRRRAGHLVVPERG